MKIRCFVALTLAAPTLHAGVLVSTTFEGNGRPKLAAEGGGAAAYEAVGTIDTYRGERGDAAVWTAPPTSSAGALVVGPLAVENTEADLAKLTLGFDLWVSDARPIAVRIASAGSDGSQPATRTAIIYPPVSNAFYRFNIDLDQMTADRGTFDPLASEITVALAPEAKKSEAEFTLQVDNLSYTAPSFYVSPNGNDGANGISAETAFASVQKAVNVAAPGDVILLMEGTFRSPPRGHLADIYKKGRPDRWIVLRAHPGQTPVLTGDGWNVISLNHESAYIEMRGLTLRGNRSKLTVEAATADTETGEFPDCAFNTNGIALDARKGNETDGKAHHIRVIGCTVGEMPGGGISMIAGDHITVEGNLVFDNCHLMRYAGSGISVFRAWDFDTDTGYKNFVIANRAHGNRCFVLWTQIGKISDGNGIIIDDFINYQEGASKIPYEGRTLVQNNLTFGNGGSGIHAYAANHVDIVNNTAFHNAQSPELEWRQIFAGGRSRDVRVVNNILWSQRGKPVNFSKPDSSSEIVYAHNLSFGDGDNGTSEGGGLGTGESKTQARTLGNIEGNPLFVNPTLDAATANFHLQPGSPAIGAGTREFPGVPIIDLDDLLRLVDQPVDCGAYAAPGAKKM